MTTQKQNADWLRRVADYIDVEGSFKLAAHDTTRLREIADALVEAGAEVEKLRTACKAAHDLLSGANCGYIGLDYYESPTYRADSVTEVESQLLAALAAQPREVRK